MNIPIHLYKNDTCHCSIISDNTNGLLSCGFLYKPNDSFTQIDLTFDYYGAFILLDGAGTYSERDGTSYPILPGSYVQRLPGRMHTTTIDSQNNWLEFFVCFGKQTYETLLELNLISDVPVIYSGLSPQLLHQCIHLLNCFKKYSKEQTPLLYTYAQSLVIDIFLTARYERPGSLSQSFMKQACELLCQKDSHFLSAIEVSDNLGIPYDSFRKKFKATYNISPMAYQLNYRIDLSKQLLLDTEMSLYEIALLCNFSDAFSYSKAFKNRCSISPSEFRKNYK